MSEEVHQCEYYKINQKITRKKKGTGKYNTTKLSIEVTNKERCKKKFKNESSLTEYTIGDKTYKYCHSHYPGQFKYSENFRQNCDVFTEYAEKMSPGVDHMSLLYRWTNCRGLINSSSKYIQTCLYQFKRQ